MLILNLQTRREKLSEELIEYRQNLREKIVEYWTEQFGRAPTEQEIRLNMATLEYVRHGDDKKLDDFLWDAIETAESWP